MQFKEYLTEATKEGKNVHLDHIEEEVLNRGVPGARDAINFLQSLRDMLAGHSESKVNVTTKWDGCVHEDTIIKTNIGDLSIRYIVENPNIWKDIKIIGKNLQSGEVVETDMIHGIQTEGVKSWVEIVLENNKIIKLTEDHEVHTRNRGWVEAKDLTIDDDITEL